MKNVSIQRIFALVALLLLVVTAAATAQDERRLYVSVEASMATPVPGIGKDDFRVFENGVEREVLDVDSSKEPMSVGILFDISNSVLSWGPRDLNAALEGLDKMVRAGSATNEYFLIGFNKERRLLQDWTSSPDRFREGLEKLSELQRESGGSTSLHDTCLSAIEKLKFGKNRKRVLIVFSDGIESSKKPRPKDVIKAVGQSNALVYFVTVLDAPQFNLIIPGMDQSSMREGASMVEMQGNALVNQLTTMSGGRVYFVVSTKPGVVRRPPSYPLMEEIFVKLQNNVNSQYAVRYRPTTVVKEDSREIEVKVTIPREVKKEKKVLAVRFRKTYEAR